MIIRHSHPGLLKNGPGASECLLVDFKLSIADPHLVLRLDHLVLDSLLVSLSGPLHLVILLLQLSFDQPHLIGGVVLLECLFNHDHGFFNVSDFSLQLDSLNRYFFAIKCLGSLFQELNSRGVILVFSLEFLQGQNDLL